MPSSEQHLTTLFNYHQGWVTRGQVLEAGLHPRLLTQWVRSGKAQRLQRGVYRAVDAPGISHEDLLEVQLRLPYAVICLASALAFHGLTTHQPPQIHLAIPRNRADPKLVFPPTRVFYYPKAMYVFGIENHQIPAGVIKVYSKEKTLADLLRFSKALGMDLFYEGLKTYLKKTRNKPDVGKLLEAAKVSKVEAKMRETLELLLFKVDT